MKVARRQMKVEVSALTLLEMSGEHTRPRSAAAGASHGKTVFGETPNTTSVDACAPRNIDLTSGSADVFGEFTVLMADFSRQNPSHQHTPRFHKSANCRRVQL
jgi:hypothetical protein